MATTSLGRLTLDLAVRLAEFTDGMNRAERETEQRTRNMRSSVRAFRDQVSEDLGDTGVGRVVGQLSDRLSVLRSGGLVAGAALGGMLVGGAAVAAGALSRLAVQTAQADVQMAILADRANTGVRNFQILGRAAEKLGVDQEQLGSILADVQEKLGEFSATEGGGAADFFEALQNNTSLTTEQIRALGKEVQGKDGVEAIQLMKDKMDALGATSQEQRFVFESLASDLGNLMPLFANGGEVLNKYGEELEAAGVIKTQEAIEQSKILTAQTQAMSIRYEGLKTQLASQMIPVLGDLLGELTGNTSQGGKLSTSIASIGDVSRSVGTYIIGLVYGLRMLANVVTTVLDVAGAAGDTFANFQSATTVTGKLEALQAGTRYAINRVKQGNYDSKALYAEGDAAMNRMMNRQVTVQDDLVNSTLALNEVNRDYTTGLSYSTKQADEEAKAQAKLTKEREKAAKSAAKQAAAEARLVGISGDTGVGNAHLHIQYRDKSRPVSQADKDRFLYGGKPISAWRKTSGFGPRNTGIKGASTYHRGEDYAIPDGTEITTTIPVKSVKPWFDEKGGGWVSTVTFADGVQIDFLHQNPAVKNVKRGASSNVSSQVKAAGQASELISREQERIEAERQRQLEREEQERQSIRIKYMDEQERLTLEHEQRINRIKYLFGEDSKEQMAEEREYQSQMHNLRMRDAQEFIRTQQYIEGIRSRINKGNYGAGQSITDTIARQTMSESGYAMFSLGNQEDMARAGVNQEYSERQASINARDSNGDFVIQSALERNQLLEEAKAEHEAKMYAIDLDFANKRKELEKEVTDKKIALYQSATGSILGVMQGFFGESKTLQRLAWASDKGMTLARILLKEKEALMNAWGSAPFPYNLGAVATTAVETGALAAAASAITPKGFQAGGYTGNMGVDQAAGIVHGQEFVFDAMSTKTIGVDNLERIRQGKGLGGDINIYNYAPGVDATATRRGDGGVDVKIEQSIKQSWANLQNPNSFESNMINAGYQVQRRRR